VKEKIGEARESGLSFAASRLCVNYSIEREGSSCVSEIEKTLARCRWTWVRAEVYENDSRKAAKPQR